MPGIGLITNPRSRANKRDPGRVRRLGYMIGSHGNAEATKSLDDLYRVCEEFKKEQIDVLGISGGDGTLHHTLTAMIKVYGAEPLPLVAILRGGTMNTIANSFRIHGKTSQLLFELVDKHRLGGDFEIFEREVLQIGDSFGFIFGNGLIYNFLAEYYGTGHPSPQTAARILLEGVASAAVRGKLAERLCKRVHARVTVDGQTWACHDFLSLAASMVEEMGFGFRPFYRCTEQRGKFPMLGIHASPIGFVSELPRMRAAKPLRRDKAIEVLAAEVLIESDEPVGYTIDGDIYQSDKTLTLKVGPRLKFIRLTGKATSEAELPAEPASPHDRADVV